MTMSRPSPLRIRSIDGYRITVRDFDVDSLEQGGCFRVNADALHSPFRPGHIEVALVESETNSFICSENPRSVVQGLAEGDYLHICPRPEGRSLDADDLKFAAEAALRDAVDDDPGPPPKVVHIGKPVVPADSRPPNAAQVLQLLDMTRERVREAIRSGARARRECERLKIERDTALEDLDAVVKERNELRGRLAGLEK